MGEPNFGAAPNFRACGVAKATSAELGRSFRNVPRASSSRTPCTGICHLCFAGRPNYDYEDVCLYFSFRTSVVWGVWPLVLVEKNVLSPCMFQYKLKNFDFFLRCDHPNFYGTMHAELPWEQEAIFTRVLMHDVGRKAGFHKIDIFHTVNLGIGKSFAASSLSILQQLCHHSSIEKRLQSLSSSYIEFCVDFQPWF